MIRTFKVVFIYIIINVFVLGLLFSNDRFFAYSDYLSRLFIPNSEEAYLEDVFGLIRNNNSDGLYSQFVSDFKNEITIEVFKEHFKKQYLKSDLFMIDKYYILSRSTKVSYSSGDKKIVLKVIIIKSNGKKEYLLIKIRKINKVFEYYDIKDVKLLTGQRTIEKVYKPTHYLGEN